MKNFTTIFLALTAFFFLNNNLNAQAFQKGNKNLDIGIGFGAYGTASTFSTTINGVTLSSTETDGAASTIFPIGFEYGVGEKIGVGVDFIYNNYLINDSDKVVLQKVSSIDFGTKFNYHLLNSDKNDLFIGIGIGFSSIKWTYQGNATNIIESASGSGIYFSLGITDRIFFSDNIGILFNLGYRGYNYSSIEANFSSTGEAALIAFGITDYEQSWSWNMKGVHIGTGLAIKF